MRCQSPEDRDARVVDPGVDAAELAHHRVAQPPDILSLADIADDGDRLPSLLANSPGYSSQRFFVPGGGNYLRAVLGRHARCDQADPGAGARDDDDLLVERLQLCGHGGSWFLL